MLPRAVPGGQPGVCLLTYFSFYIPKLSYPCTNDLFGFEKEFWEREEKAAVLRLVESFYMTQFSESWHIFFERT